MVPVIVVGGIVGGIASPTESATFAVVYDFAAALVVYRSLGLRSSWTALRDAALTAGMVLFMVATSNLVSQAIVIDGLGRTPRQGVYRAAHPRVPAGHGRGDDRCGVDARGHSGDPDCGAHPAAHRHACWDDPLQYGIVLTMAVGIGVFLPPVGIGYYVACAIGEAPVNATMRPSFIYSGFLVLGLVIVVSCSRRSPPGSRIVFGMH